MTSISQLSPDGNWWWDTSAWRPVSPDRRWWWDGNAWQPMLPSVRAVEAVNLDPSISAPSLTHLRLQYAGNCLLCGREIEKGAEAQYDRVTRTIRCIECRPRDEASNPLPPLNFGAAGESAHREYERRRAARETRVKAKLGNLMGGVALAVAGDEQSTVAWERGAIGEQQLAAALAGVAGVQVLHDRRVPGTKGNIDHIVIGPPGVFVIDAKNYRGTIRIRDRGTIFKRDDRLYVGGRDRSKLAENIDWQVEAVKRVLQSVGPDLPAIQVQPVLCFIDGEWPLLSPPTSFKGVRLEGKRSVRDLVGRGQLLNAQQIERLTRSLSVAFPAK